MFSDFDAIDELGGNLGGLMLPPAQPSSSDYGAYLHKNPAFSQAQLNSGPRVKPVSKEVSPTLHKRVRGVQLHPP